MPPEAASSLTALTNNAVAVKAAAGKFIELAIKEADNNVKLIVLERVNQLRQKNEGILDDLVMEVLRVLTSPDIDVRKKALEIALEEVDATGSGKHRGAALLGATGRGKLAYGEGERGEGDERAFTGRPT